MESLGGSGWGLGPSPEAAATQIVRAVHSMRAAVQHAPAVAMVTVPTGRALLLLSVSRHCLSFQACVNFLGLLNSCASLAFARDRPRQFGVTSDLLCETEA